VTSILECIVCSENSDIERFVKFFEEEIKAKNLPHYKAFDKTKKHIKLLPEEKDEAKKEKKNLKGKKESAKNSMADLEKMILAKREKGFGGFLNYMEAKYGGD
jgi:hypothetical protein